MGDALRQLRLLLVLAILCVLGGVSAPAPAGAAYTGDTMIDAINYARASGGLHTLKRSRRLIRSSAARADLMMRADIFAHPSVLQVPTFDRVGEVLELHGGRRPRVMRTLRLWVNSPAHMEVLRVRGFRWIGAARSTGRFRGNRATIWVVRFGRH